MTKVTGPGRIDRASSVMANSPNPISSPPFRGSTGRDFVVGREEAAKELVSLGRAVADVETVDAPPHPARSKSANGISIPFRLMEMKFSDHGLWRGKGAVKYVYWNGNGSMSDAQTTSRSKRQASETRSRRSSDQ
jgi:hypothetical protein